MFRNRQILSLNGMRNVFWISKEMHGEEDFVDVDSSLYSLLSMGDTDSRKEFWKFCRDPSPLHAVELLNMTLGVSFHLEMVQLASAIHKALTEREVGGINFRTGPHVIAGSHLIHLV